MSLRIYKVAAVAFLGMLTVLAQAYGAGSYNSAVYGGNGSIAIGPLSLPTTGATWLTLGGALFVAVSAGLLVWLGQQRRARRSEGVD
jgi:LPXTG-motif cell wall-anchored protein